jgi:hypothetical protein
MSPNLLAMIRSALGLIAFAAAAWPAQAQSAGCEAEVLALHRQKFSWMEQAQTDSLALLLDERVAYIHSNGWNESKTEVLDNLASGKLAYRQVEVLEETARCYEASAIVTGKGLFSVALEGRPLEIKLYYSEVYVRQGTAWRLASRHACRIE